MKTSKIKVSVKGDGLTYEGEVDSFTAAKIVALCMETNNEDKTKINTDGLKISGLTKESPAEYLNRHAPHNNFEKILTLGGYVAEHQSKDWFTVNEIRALFRSAAEGLPTNITRDFQVITKRGWIAEDLVSKDPKRKGSFYITPTGKKALTMGFEIKK